MADSWDDYAAAWDGDECARCYAHAALASLKKHIEVGNSDWKGKRVLDFGCGTGLLSELLAPLVKEVVAIDTSEKMIDVLRRKRITNIDPICLDIDEKHDRSDADFGGGFDLIVASSVCGFLPDYEATVDTLGKLLVSGGYFVQWDWLASGDQGFGLPIEGVSTAIGQADLACVHVGEAFSIVSKGEEMPVLVGVGRAV